jgi:hypothetical protein
MSTRRRAVCLGKLEEKVPVFVTDEGGFHGFNALLDRFHKWGRPGLLGSKSS